MSDEKQQAVFNIRRVYLKDASFETPMGFQAFRQEFKPTFSQNISTKVNNAGEDLFECELTITFTAQLGEDDNKQTAFIVEVQQAGIFFAKGMEEKQRRFLLQTLAPSILFPYLREAIDSLVVKGGFPPPNLPPVNFEALFKQAQEQQQQAEQASKH